MLPLRVGWMCQIFVLGLPLCVFFYVAHRHLTESNRDAPPPFADSARQGWELDGPFSEITCGSCKFQTNSETLVLERTVGGGTDCGACTDLDLTTGNFLGVAPGTFDAMTAATIDMSGLEISNFPANLFENFAPASGVTTVTLTGNSVLTCTPKTPGNGKAAFVVDQSATDGGECSWVKECGGCDFYITPSGDNKGLVSMGGECKKTCLELNLSGVGVTKLPRAPNGIIDSIKILQALYLDNGVDLLVTRHFSLPNLWGRRLYVLRPDGNSWMFLGKAWFKTNQDHDFSLTSLVQ